MTREYTLYHCVFNFKGEELTATSINGIAAFQTGFWINEYLHYTTGSDAWVWIPPSQIKYVYKDPREE